DHGFATCVLDERLQVINLAFLGEGRCVAAVATAAPVVVVDREVAAKEVGQLCHAWVKGTIDNRAVDQDDGRAGPNLVESNLSAVVRTYCRHGIPSPRLTHFSLAGHRPPRGRSCACPAVP